MPDNKTLVCCLSFSPPLSLPLSLSMSRSSKPRTRHWKACRRSWNSPTRRPRLPRRVWSAVAWRCRAACRAVAPSQPFSKPKTPAYKPSSGRSNSSRPSCSESKSAAAGCASSSSGRWRCRAGPRTRAPISSSGPPRPRRCSAAPASLTPSPITCATAFTSSNIIKASPISSTDT